MSVNAECLPKQAGLGKRAFMVTKSSSSCYQPAEGRERGREALGAVIGYYVGFLRRLLESDVWWPRLSASGYNLLRVRLKILSRDLAECPTKQVRNGMES